MTRRRTLKIARTTARFSYQIQPDRAETENLSGVIILTFTA